MEQGINTRVCPVEMAGSLDTSFRRLVHNPRRMLNPYINKGTTVLDFGCGPGFFTIEIAKMVTETGKVIAADLQEGMLEKVNLKIKESKLEKRVELHKCGPDKIGLSETVDFILAFYMIHEVPDHESLFEEINLILKPGGILFIAEPIFHVSKSKFKKMINRLITNGYEVVGNPRIFISRSVVVRRKV